MASFHFEGRFSLLLLSRDGELIYSAELPNGTTLAGLADMAACYFAAGAQRAWHMGLIDAAGYTAVSPSDTMASHAGWAESTAYAEATRLACLLTASGVAVTTPAPCAFTASGTVTVQGAFIASDGTKGGTAGVLWATGLLPTPVTMQPGQQLLLNYTSTGSGS